MEEIVVTSADMCRVMIEQHMADCIAKGDKVEPAARETANWIKEKFNVDFKPDTIAKAERRKLKAAELAANPDKCPKPKLTKDQKDYLKKAAIQAKHDVAVHQNNSGEMPPLPDFNPAMDRARSAISYLKEIQADDPKRLEALLEVAEYLDSQGIGFFPVELKTITS